MNKLDELNARVARELFGWSSKEKTDPLAAFLMPYHSLLRIHGHFTPATTAIAVKFTQLQNAARRCLGMESESLQWKQSASPFWKLIAYLTQPYERPKNLPEVVD